MRQSRRGFTLIEILVVIGIIMILVGLLVVGFRHINATAATKETTAELKICRGLLQDYESRNQLQNIEFFAGSPPTTTTDTTRQAPVVSPNRFPVYADAATGVTVASQWPSISLLDVTGGGTSGGYTDMGDKTSGTASARYSKAVTRTFDVMYVLMRIPSNQTIVQSVQAKRILEPIPPATTPFLVTQGAVLLDGWGNPIIFVPRAGIHVNIKDPTTGVPVLYVVRSTGTFNASGGDPPMTGNERPFWASAGQNGDFTLGEDNVYSFQD